MDQLKKLGFLFLAVALLGGGLLPEASFAAPKNETVNLAPTEGISSKNSKFGEGQTGDVGSEAFQYFKMGTTSIKSVSSSRISVTGDTSAYSPVDTIVVDLYLQRWDASNGVWVDVFHIGETKNFNSSYVYKGIDVNVVSGYYYRTRALHWVSESGVLEQSNSYSSYIYVN